MYTIRKNGQVHANFTTSLRNLDKVVTEYKRQSEWLGYKVDHTAVWTAHKYEVTALDRYGN